MIYREATSSDQGAIVEFQIAMALETESFKLNRETVTKGVRGLFDQPTRGKYFVAESNSKLCASLLIINEWSDWRNGDVWWIHSVYVSPEIRSKKVFSGLYEHIKAKVMANPNLMGLRLYVEKKNGVAQKVYEKLGMKSDHYHLFEWMKNF